MKNMVFVPVTYLSFGLCLSTPWTRRPNSLHNEFSKFHYLFQLMICLLFILHLFCDDIHDLQYGDGIIFWSFVLHFVQENLVCVDGCNCYGV